ncbi:hypothetical protein KKA33_00160 [Patescibacteria group bacterium]|nr:hypothetical protein [Patescibacteria group bacterium]
MKKINLQKTKFTPSYLFYIGFFALYFLGLYFFLYHANGLQPFQTNAHFFSNVVGSLSKRFLSETAPYALIFYLLYYTKTMWKQVVLIGLFEILFLVNVMSIGFYYIHQANWQWDTLALTPLFILFLLLILMFGVGVGISSMRFKSNPENVWPFKKNLFLVLLTLLALITPMIPIQYSTHTSLVTTQQDVEKTFRVFHLEKSGTTHFYEILTDSSKPTIVPDVSSFELKNQMKGE